MRPEGVKKSLAEVESGLDDQAIALASNTDASVVALAKCVRAWTTATSLVHKQLVDSLRDIDEEKALTLGYDSADDDRRAAVRDALKALRRRIYPLVSLLVAFLDDDDPTKNEAQQCLDSGLNVIPDAALQRECNPYVFKVDV